MYAGTTGLRIRDWMAARNDVELLVPPMEQRKDPEVRRAHSGAADLTVLCLPDDSAREAAAWALEAGTRVLDRISAIKLAAPAAGERLSALEEFSTSRESAELARRGDYDEAMARLDEAESVAPTYALVQQYRSNVAYLMGEREAAIAAREKGLELEPDNALFRKNLERLRDSTP